MSRIDGYSYTKRFLPFNESESDFRIFEKNCPTHLKKEKSNVSSRRTFLWGLRIGYSVKRVLDLSLNAYGYTATDAGYTSRYRRRQGTFPRAKPKSGSSKMSVKVTQNIIKKKNRWFVFVATLWQIFIIPMYYIHKDDLWCVDSYIFTKNATVADDSSRNWQVSLSTSNIRGRSGF